MYIIETFKLKDGRDVEIIEPNIKLARELTDFVNKLSSEDTYLTFAGERYSEAFEKLWLKKMLSEYNNGKCYHIWAIIDNQIIGASDFRIGFSRENHIASLGLMVDKDYRGQGLGKFLLNYIINEAKKRNIKIITLDVFSDNTPAISLYNKLGFKQYGKLPEGFYRKGKYSDKIEMYKKIN